MIAREDIALGVAAEIALNATGPGRVECKWEGADPAAHKIIQRLIRALIVKHGCAIGAIDNKGNRKDPRSICRQLVIDILSRKKDLAPYHQIIDAFVRRNDKDFLRALGRGFDQRDAVFDDVEWRIIFHDEETDGQIAERFGKTLSAIHSTRQRLGLLRGSKVKKAIPVQVLRTTSVGKRQSCRGDKDRIISRR